MVDRLNETCDTTFTYYYMDIIVNIDNKSDLIIMFIMFWKIIEFCYVIIDFKQINQNIWKFSQENIAVFIIYLLSE